MRAALQNAFILHYRSYRETSLLLELFTEEYGRITLVSRGVRKSKSPAKALLQPFNPLLVSWQGKSELMTLTGVEANGAAVQLRGVCLLSAFYLNEVLMRVLHKHDPHPHLYTVYHKTLVELHSQELPEKTLRLFEKHLLEELGYGLQLERDISQGLSLVAEKYYRFYPEQGFDVLKEDVASAAMAMVFTGKSLIALATEQLDDAESLRDAKRLMRFVLAPLLGPQPLQSRKLFDSIK